MTSRHLVDPELLAILDVWPPLVLNTETLPSLRTMSPVVPPIAEEVLEGTSCEIQKIAGSEGAPPVEVVIFRPKELAPNKGAILHIHGGGYVLGQASQLEWMLRPWAHQLKCLIVSVEYRLAPETRFPGAVEDCYAALAWMWREAETLGVDRTRIGVKGESAGGGLAAALSLLTRDRGEFSLAFQHLTYPMLDDRTSNAAEPHPYAGEFGWTRTLNAFGWAALIGEGVDTVSPYAAPARADTLSRLPPTYLATGALDLFVEENIEFARRLLRDGVPTELHVYPGAYHGFDLVPAAVSQRAIADGLDALRRWIK